MTNKTSIKTTVKNLFVRKRQLSIKTPNSAVSQVPLDLTDTEFKLPDYTYDDSTKSYEKTSSGLYIQKASHSTVSLQHYKPCLSPSETSGKKRHVRAFSTTSISFCKKGSSKGSSTRLGYASSNPETIITYKSKLDASLVAPKTFSPSRIPSSGSYQIIDYSYYQDLSSQPTAMTADSIPVQNSIDTQSSFNSVTSHDGFFSTSSVIETKRRHRNTRAIGPSVSRYNDTFTQDANNDNINHSHNTNNLCISCKKQLRNSQSFRNTAQYHNLTRDNFLRQSKSESNIVKLTQVNVSPGANGSRTLPMTSSPLRSMTTYSSISECYATETETQEFFFDAETHWQHQQPLQQNDDSYHHRSNGSTISVSTNESDKYNQSNMVKPSSSLRNYQSTMCSAPSPIPVAIKQQRDEKEAVSILTDQSGCYSSTSRWRPINISNNIDHDDYVNKFKDDKIVLGSLGDPFCALDWDEDGYVNPTVIYV